MKFLHELVDYLHGDKPEVLKSYIIEQVAKTKDYNKGLFWEKVLEKAMKNHTELLGGNTKGKDFADNSDAKIATYYHKNDGLGNWEASVPGIKNKIGPLRICLCVPGQHYHKLHFLLVPHEYYSSYVKSPKSALKFGLNPHGLPTGGLSRFLCSFEEVTRPIKFLTLN